MEYGLKDQSLLYGQCFTSYLLEKCGSLYVRIFTGYAIRLKYKFMIPSRIKIQALTLVSVDSRHIIDLKVAGRFLLG